MVLAISPAAVRAQGAPAFAARDAEADSLFARARETWSRMSYPELVDYDVIVSVIAAKKLHSDRYSGKARPAAGDFRVDKFSVAEVARPSVPHGINVTYSIGFGVNSGARPVGKTGDNTTMHLGGSLAQEKPVEPFAIPEVSPLYSFGIRSCADRSAAASEVSGLKRIGGVTTASRRYRATVVGNETVDGVAAVHLVLAPLLDPHRDRLRDVWIDPSSGRVLRARVLGNFTGKAEASIPWLIRFTTVDGATYIATESAEAPFRRGNAVFDSVEIAFANIRPDRSATAGLSFAIPADYGALNAIQEPAESSGRSGC